MCFTPCLNDCIRFDECIMWCTQVIRGLISKGDFFQWRTLTRSGFFHSWAKVMPRFSGIRVKGKGFRIRVKKLIPVQFFLPSRNIKSENASLPVDVSRSNNGVRQYLPGHSPLLPFFLQFLGFIVIFLTLQHWINANCEWYTSMNTHWMRLLNMSELISQTRRSTLNFQWPVGSSV